MTFRQGLNDQFITFRLFPNTYVEYTLLTMPAIRYILLFENVLTPLVRKLIIAGVPYILVQVMLITDSRSKILILFTTTMYYLFVSINKFLLIQVIGRYEKMHTHTYAIV